MRPHDPQGLGGEQPAGQSVVARLPIVGLVGLVLVSGCAPRAIEVELNSYFIRVSSPEARAGEVSFDISNTATLLPHEFILLHTDLPADGLPLDEDGNVELSRVPVVIRTGQLLPGESQSLSLGLEAGRYLIVCNQQGHFAKGMVVELIVR